MFRHALSIACLAASAAAIDVAAVSQLLADIDASNDSMLLAESVSPECCTVYAQTNLEGDSANFCLDGSQSKFDLNAALPNQTVKSYTCGSGVSYVFNTVTAFGTRTYYKKFFDGAGGFSNMESRTSTFGVGPGQLVLSPYDESASPKATLFFGDNCTGVSQVVGTQDGTPKTYTLGTGDLNFDRIMSMRVPAGLSVQTSASYTVEGKGSSECVSLNEKVQDNINWGKIVVAPFAAPVASA